MTTHANMFPDRILLLQVLAILQECGYTEDRFFIHCDGALFGLMVRWSCLETIFSVAKCLIAGQTSYVTLRSLCCHSTQMGIHLHACLCLCISVSHTCKKAEVLLENAGT